MLAAVVRLIDDGAGIEKTLRLFQSIFTVLAGLALTAIDAKPWNAGRLQLGLTRRYFRLLKWHPCFFKAKRALETTTQTPVGSLLETAKWTLLGTYFFLEMFTITNASSMTEFEWSPALQDEANKFWFYGLVASILVSLYQLLASARPVYAPKDYVDKPTADEKIPKEPVKPGTKGVEQGHGRLAPSEKQLAYTQLVIDSCDILIPGSALGWIPAGLWIVGTGMTISTLLAVQPIWQRVQRQAIVA